MRTITAAVGEEAGTLELADASKRTRSAQLEGMSTLEIFSTERKETARSRRFLSSRDIQR